jgi:hypothetical protein
METNKVNASYRNIGTFNNVIVNVPGTNDKHRKMIYAHQIVVDDQTIFVPDHFRRGDIIEGYFVTRNIFPESLFQKKFQKEKSQKMVAKVTVVEKTDHSRGDQKSLILDIYLDGGCLDLEKGELILAIGTTAGEFPVPYTSKFIAFKKRS